MNTKIICFSSGKENEDILSSEKILFTLISQLELDPPEIIHISADIKELSAELKTAALHNQLIFLCGNTDLSKKAVCSLYKLQLNTNENYKAFLDKKDFEYSETKAAFPQGSSVTFSRKTGDDAFCLKIPGKTIFSVPAVPISINDAVTDFIIAYFGEEKGKYLSRINLKLFDVNDSLLSLAIKGIQNKYNVNICRLSQSGNTELEISACTKSADESDNICYEAINEIKNAFGNSIYEIGNRNLAQASVDLLKRNGLTVSTAESCTGGMLSEAITSVSGASNVLEIGICAYSNRIKRDALGVSEETLSTYGAVSKETAMALAKGIKKLSKSTLGVGITGVAGPEKSEDKEVGTVYIALYDGERYWVRLLSENCFSDREEIREYATATALDLLRRYSLFLPDVMPGSCTETNVNVLSSQPDIISDSILNSEESVCDIKAEEEFVTESLENPQTEVSDNTQVLYEDYEENLNPEAVEPLFIADTVPSAESEAVSPVYVEDDTFDFISNVPNKQEEKSYPFELAAENYNDKVDIVISNDEEPQIDNNTPKAKKGKNSKWIKIIFAASTAIILTIAIIFGVYFYKVYRDLSQIDDARAIFSSTSKQEAFEKLSSQNEDFAGWLSIGDTEINNPIYQASDNSYYATHNMKKQSSRYGALFFDYRNIISGDKQSKNLVIYGQNMNDGAMFGSLSKFRNISFINSHSTLTLTTADISQTYKVFAVIVTNASKNEDDGRFFDFSRPSFDDEETFNKWINELNAKNLYKTANFNISYEDQLLTLVTTCDDFTNARLVVVAKRSGNADEAVTYTINPSPVFPAAYYKAKGQQVPTSGDIWDNSSLTTSSTDSTSSDDTSTEVSSPDVSSNPSTVSTPTTQKPSTPSSSQNSSSEVSSESSSENSSSESSSDTASDTSETSSAELPNDENVAE